MPRVHHVKKARKANRDYGIKKGDSYYWWKFRRGGKRVSKTPPKPSQLTMSEFWGFVYGLQEGNEEVPALGDMESALEDIKSQLEEHKDEIDSKLQNMPDSLQQGPTGELLQERIDALDSVISELDSVDIPERASVLEDAEIKDPLDDWKPTKKQPEQPEDTEEIVQALSEATANAWQEVTGALEGISCG